MKKRRKIEAKHRRLATHTGDLHMHFFRQMKGLSMVKRKKALVAKIRSLGWSFLKINRKLTHKFWLRNTTYRRLIVLGTEWVTKTLREQCLTLAHELIHVWQRIRMGSAKFLARYGIAQYRWALETSAYRINEFFWPRGARGNLDRARWMYKFYRLGRLRKTITINETVAVLTA